VDRVAADAAVPEDQAELGVIGAEPRCSKMDVAVTQAGIGSALGLAVRISDGITLEQDLVSGLPGRAGVRGF
jgi:hypothetical protein